MVAGNLYALQNFFNVNWSTKWVAKPTFKEWEQRKHHESGDFIYYSGGEPVETRIGNGWVDRKQTFNFQLRSTTQGNVELMFEELKYCVDNLFYPAPFTPMSHESEVLCYLDCNNTGDGAGDHVHDYQAAYDFTFGGGGLDPAWAATGALNRKNFLQFRDVGDWMYNGTLIDTMPAAMTWELLVKPNAVYEANIELFKKNTTMDEIYLYIVYGGYVNTVKIVNSVSVSISAGAIAAGKWANVMMTCGPRGYELYINGILVGYNTSVTMLANGTTSNFEICNNGASCNWDFSIFRCSSVQRLPWDPKGLTLSLKDVQHGPGYYFADCEVIGSLSNVYVGGHY